jgi:hypothetical protein
MVCSTPHETPLALLVALRSGLAGRDRDAWMAHAAGIGIGPRRVLGSASGGRGGECWPSIMADGRPSYAADCYRSRSTSFSLSIFLRAS